MTTQPNLSVGRALDVLHALCAADAPVGSRELARLLRMEHTRTNRLLGTLAQLGLAARTADRKYVAGPGVHVLAASGLRSSGLLQAALPVIRPLQAGGVGVAIGVLWRDQVAYLYHGAAGEPIETGLAGHGLFPAQHSSIGAVLRAHAPGGSAAVRAAGWSAGRPPGGGGSVAAPIGDPPIAALALIPPPGTPPEALAPRVVAAARQVQEALAARRRR